MSCLGNPAFGAMPKGREPNRHRHQVLTHFHCTTRGTTSRVRQSTFPKLTVGWQCSRCFGFVHAGSCEGVAGGADLLLYIIYIYVQSLS